MSYEARVNCCRQAIEQLGHKHISFAYLDDGCNFFKIWVGGTHRTIPLPDNIDADSVAAQAAIKEYVEGHLTEWAQALGL